MVHFPSVGLYKGSKKNVQSYIQKTIWHQQRFGHFKYIYINQKYSFPLLLGHS